MTTRRIAISTPDTGEEEWLALKEPLMSGWITQGPKVREFEEAFAARHDCVYGVATTSCTTALHLMLIAAGVGPGDEVIVPAFTWVSTANAVVYCGATPVFADVDPVTNNLDLESVLSVLTPRTKAVLVVHLFGLCVDVPRMEASLPSHVVILEDCACAAGATLRGNAAGSLGQAGAFSFHPRKAITTGEGGMVTTNDAALASRVEILRNHGASISEEERHRGARPYLLPDFDVLGYNFRMTDLQGALGIVQFSKLDRILAERQHWAEYYIDQLSQIEWLKMPEVPVDGQHAWQSFVCRLDAMQAPVSRNSLMEILQERGISTRPGTHAVHMLGYYRETYGFAPEDFPGARSCNDDTIAIPLHNRMCDEDFEYVVTTLRQIRA